MNGSDLGRAVAAQIAALFVMAFVIGGMVALGGYFGIDWIIAHVSLHFS